MRFCFRCIRKHISPRWKHYEQYWGLHLLHCSTWKKYEMFQPPTARLLLHWFHLMPRLLSAVPKFTFRWLRRAKHPSTVASEFLPFWCRFHQFCALFNNERRLWKSRMAPCNTRHIYASGRRWSTFGEPGCRGLLYQWGMQTLSFPWACKSMSWLR